MEGDHGQARHGPTEVKARSLRREVMPKKRLSEHSGDLNEDQFLGFAKSYLYESFPNPQRIGCPEDSHLQRMAEHPVEARDAGSSEHLTSCSPCFRRYMEILADLRRRTSG
jgi:hypothetical protein